jgi:hypothetical protein
MSAYKIQRTAMALTFIEWYQKDDDEIFSHIIIQVTDDEIWVSFVNVESKEQSEQ